MPTLPFSNTAGYLYPPDKFPDQYNQLTFGQTVRLAFWAETSGLRNNCTFTFLETPDDFVPEAWSYNLFNAPPLPLNAPGPVIVAEGTQKNVGPATIVYPLNTFGMFLLVDGTFLTQGLKTFRVQISAEGMTPTILVAQTRIVEKRINLGLPVGCDTAPTGWPPDNTAGKLVFSFGYTIPNYCVRFVEGGPFELHVPTYEGEDVDTVGGRIPRGRVERVRTARIACQMLFGVGPDGTPYNSLQEGMVRNWRDICDLTIGGLLSEQTNPPEPSFDGTSWVQYTPYVGGPTYEFEAHILPPVPGSVQIGVGMAFGLILEVPNPTGNLP